LPITVSKVLPGSAADAAQIPTGASITDVNDVAISDQIDFMVASTDDRLEISYMGPAGTPHTATIVRTFGQPIGLALEPIKPRICCNKCIFCFVDQMPTGLRPPLYVKDDDYRLSFLFGNFITATNISRANLKRIERLGISPLYVSVHATDDSVRTKMLGNPAAPPILPALGDLIRSGAKLHTQVVLCPGINDGKVLQQTISDLTSLFPGVQTIAIVPVGLTRFRERLSAIEPVSPSYAGQLIEQMQPIQSRLGERFDRQVLFLSDEFYLMSGVRLPKAREYGEFAQLENGVGIAASFAAELDEALGGLESRASLVGARATIVTGRLAAPMLSRAIGRVNQAFGTRLSLLEVGNRFFGESVTVAGLLVGQDIRQRMLAEGFGSNDLVLVPEAALEDESADRKGDLRRFLDGMTLKTLKQETGAAIEAAPVQGRKFVRFLKQYLAARVNPTQ